MTIQLAPPEFQHLVSILEVLPEFGTVRDRRRLLESAFSGFARSQSILSRVDLEGAPRGAAVGLIQHLLMFGQVEPRRHALGVLLDEILANMGLGDNADFLSDLIVRYTLKPASPLSVLPVPSPDTAPDAGNHYVFISYAHPDQAIAEQVETYLIAVGFRTFRDMKDIHSGDNWDVKIETALNEATDMVLLLSDSSMPYRKEVNREWFYFDQKGKSLRPLLIQNCKLHSRLISINYIDARGCLGDALKQLVIDLLV